MRLIIVFLLMLFPLVHTGACACVFASVECECFSSASLLLKIIIKNAPLTNIFPPYPPLLSTQASTFGRVSGARAATGSRFYSSAKFSP